MKRLLVTLVLVAVLVLMLAVPAFAGTSAAVGCSSAAVGSLLGPNVATSSCGAAAASSSEGGAGTSAAVGCSSAAVGSLLGPNVATSSCGTAAASN